MPIDHQLFRRVAGKVAQLQSDVPYRLRHRARTGKLNDDGTLNPDPCAGLDPALNLIWIRSSFDNGVNYSRAAVPGWCKVRNDYADLPIWAGYEGLNLVAIEGRVDEESISQLGQFTAAMGTPTTPSNLQNQVTQAALLDVGLVRPSDDGGYTLVVNAFGGGQWIQTTVDVSALASPAANTVALGVVMFDPYDLGAFLSGTASVSYPDTTYGIGAPYFADIPLMPGAYPLAGIAVSPSATEISKTTMAAQQAAIIDLRLWLEQYQTGGYWIVAGASTIPAGVSGVIPNGVRVTSGGTLTINGTLCIP